MLHFPVPVNTFEITRHLEVGRTLIHSELNLVFLFVFLDCRFINSSSISGITIYNLIIFPEKISGFAYIMHICRCISYCIDISTACIDTSICLYPKVSLVSFLGLMHFRIAFAVLILSGFRRI